jgi:hypothetical protein
MFQIVQVPEEAAEFSEQMGTKFKFWYQNDELELTLFKEGRPGTGENWAEVLAGELAPLLGIPHATYQLAEWRNRPGVITRNFVPEGARLIHGNELVGGKVTVGNDNTQVRYYEQRSHVASRVFQFLKLNEDFISSPDDFLSFDGVATALSVFIGYLMFDVWISNQDRHAENWGVVRTKDKVYLAPSYDHGSSLGRQHTDERRQAMLTTKDRGSSISTYVSKARSAMYPNSPPDVKTKSYLGLDLLELACKLDIVAARAWRSRLAQISSNSIRHIIDEVPDQYMSKIAKDFTATLLSVNKDRILSLELIK